MLDLHVRLRGLAALALLSVSFAAPVATAQSTVIQTPLSASEWREDLHFLAAQMREKHKSLFHTMTETEFNQAVLQLDSDIPHLNSDQIYVRFLQLMALVQDGHTGFDSRPVPSAGVNDRIPICFDRYADGIYVRAAAPEYKDAVGGKVLKVGGVDWQEAIRRVDSTESHDPGNEGERLAWSAKTSLNWPRLLYGLGLSRSPDSAEFVIEKSGQSRVFSMKASVPLGEWYVDSIPAGWVDARPSSVVVPLSRQHEDKHYWFTYLPDHHAVYFQFNLVINGDDESLEGFAARLATALEKPGVERIVIDLRNNTGGDNTLLRPLLMALFRSRQNRRGSIYAIIGPTTFSAAQNFVNRLENYSDVIFVGRPTAENVNFYGDPAGITLPHSHLHAAVSQLWWQDKDPRDKRTATSPELTVEPTFNDYISGKDVALELALTTATPKTIEETLEGSLGKGIDATLDAYRSFVVDPQHKYLSDPEAKINRLGYKFLSAKRVNDAIVVFEVNARTHPNSWNAFDSLGEAYANAGEKAEALAAYRKSLELYPQNASAKEMIGKIESAK